MSLLRANDIPVARAEISIPRVGRAVADLLLASEKGPKLGEAVKLIWQDGTTMAFTCVLAEKAGGWWKMRVVAGKGKLDIAIPGRYYEGIPAATVARDIIREAGEEPGDIDLPGAFQRYVRRAGPAWQALATLLAGFNRIWRVQFDGKVWVGKDKEEPTEQLEASEGYPNEGRYVLELNPTLEPGRVLKAILDSEERELGRIERIRHIVGPRLRTEVWCGKAEGGHT